MQKIQIWTLAIAFAVGLGLMSPGSVFAGQNNKTQVCHFKQDAGEWQLKTVTLNGLENHLMDHDDAIPGDETSETGTVLDAECVEVTICPCFNQADVEEIPGPLLVCESGEFPERALALGEDESGTQIFYCTGIQCAADDVVGCGGVTGPEGGVFGFYPISEEEDGACRAIIAARCEDD